MSLWTPWGKGFKGVALRSARGPPSVQRPALGSYTTPGDANVVADNDRIIPAALQLAFAGKMRAKTSHVASSHVPMLSRPQAVADAILAAVDGAK